MREVENMNKVKKEQLEFFRDNSALNGIKSRIMEHIPNIVVWYDDHPHLPQHALDIHIVDINSKKADKHGGAYYDIRYLMSARYFISEDENVMEDITNVESFSETQKKIYETAKSLKTILSHIEVDGEILEITPFYSEPDYQIAHGVLHFLFNVRERISESLYEKNIQKLDSMPIRERGSWIRKLPHLRLGKNN